MYCDRVVKEGREEGRRGGGRDRKGEKRHLFVFAPLLVFARHMSRFLRTYARETTIPFFPRDGIPRGLSELSERFPRRQTISIMIAAVLDTAKGRGRFLVRFEEEEEEGAK